MSDIIPLMLKKREEKSLPLYIPKKKNSGEMHKKILTVVDSDKCY